MVYGGRHATGSTLNDFQTPLSPNGIVYSSSSSRCCCAGAFPQEAHVEINLEPPQYCTEETIMYKVIKVKHMQKEWSCRSYNVERQATTCL